MAARVCRYCGSEFTRRPRERNLTYSQRQHCNDDRCRSLHRAALIAQKGSYNHVPTPEEIQQRCQEIQDGWSTATEQRRRSVPEQPVEVDVCDILNAIGRTSGTGQMGSLASRETF